MVVPPGTTSNLYPWLNPSVHPFQLIQQTMGEREKAFREQESLIAKLTAKLQKSDETITELMEQNNMLTQKFNKQKV
jgi:predicted esterase YcpF (UPF0227 family)